MPSVLLSCGHHSWRRVMCPGVRGCPLSPCMPTGQPPPSPRPRRSPTIAPTDLPASSHPRCSIPFSRAAALMRNPGGHTPTPKKTASPGVRSEADDSQAPGIRCPSVFPVAVCGCQCRSVSSLHNLIKIEGSSLKIDGISCPTG